LPFFTFTYNSITYNCLTVWLCMYIICYTLYCNSVTCKCDRLQFPDAVLHNHDISITKHNLQHKENHELVRYFWQNLYTFQIKKFNWYNTIERPWFFKLKLDNDLSFSEMIFFVAQQIHWILRIRFKLHFIPK